MEFSSTTLVRNAVAFCFGLVVTLAAGYLLFVVQSRAGIYECIVFGVVAGIAATVVVAVLSTRTAALASATGVLLAVPVGFVSAFAYIVQVGI